MKNTTPTTQITSGFVAILMLLLSLQSCQVTKKEEVANTTNTNIFEVQNPDFELSPYTGMTREHWVAAAEYLLEGAFSHIDSLGDAMKFPKQPGKTYPHDEGRVPTEKLEGLCRTLFVAAPLLKENPSLELNGIKVAQYYRYHIAQLVNPKSPSYIVPRPKEGGPDQNLVEFGALAISLFLAPEVVWEPLPKETKDALAATMLSYGDGPTVPSNWKFFNIFVLSFFKDQGYTVNEDLLQEYLTKSLADYRGDGWYNDNPAYDYYSMWAFQTYGIVWAEVFGKKYYPELADGFIANFQELQNSYPYLYAKDGHMVMWGRSISYRFASVAPFPFMGKYANDNVNLGWMRRIASSTMLQFLQHPDFLKDSVPTLGFYGAFEPAVQNYSCRGSVFWMGKAFLGLLLPEDDPFWTATEEEGVWSTYKKDSVYNYFAEAPQLLVTDYPELGASEIRAWCHEKVADDWQGFRSSENYNKLAYSSAFLWQADGSNGEIAMNYGLKNMKQEWEVFRLYTFKKYENGTYYRDAVLETSDAYQMNLADIPLPNGILRVDRNISTTDVAMKLGNYALPQLEDEITETTMEKEGYEVTIIDNGKYQLATVVITGWESISVTATEGLNPEATKSAIPTLQANYKQTDGKKVYATLFLWKKSGEEWTDEELVPLKYFSIADDANSVTVTLKSGEVKQVVY